MSLLRCMKAEDQPGVEHLQSGRAEIDPSPLIGCWVNTNSESRGIVKVEISLRGGALVVRVFGPTDGVVADRVAGDSSPGDWGETEADAIYARGVDQREAMAFSASYDLGPVEAHLQANLSLGLLVVATFNTFKDGSGRSDYFSREFYHL